MPSENGGEQSGGKRKRFINLATRSADGDRANEKRRLVSSTASPIYTYVTGAGCARVVKYLKSKQIQIINFKHNDLSNL